MSLNLVFLFLSFCLLFRCCCLWFCLIFMCLHDLMISCWGSMLSYVWLLSLSLSLLIILGVILYMVPLWLVDPCGLIVCCIVVTWNLIHWLYLLLCSTTGDLCSQYNHIYISVMFFTPCFTRLTLMFCRPMHFSVSMWSAACRPLALVVFSCLSFVLACENSSQQGYYVLLITCWSRMMLIVEM
jgi:hypothetical protein